MNNKKMKREVIKYCYKYFGGIAFWRQHDDDYVNLITNDGEEREFFIKDSDDGNKYVIEQTMKGVNIDGDRQYDYYLVWRGI